MAPVQHKVQPVLSYTNIENSSQESPDRAALAFALDAREVRSVSRTSVPYVSWIIVMAFENTTSRIL